LIASKIGYELFDQKKFIKMTLLILRGHNVLTSSSFLLILNVIDVQRGELYVLLGHHKQWEPLAKTTRNHTLSVL
jgi:hypothetical protein